LAKYNMDARLRWTGVRYKSKLKFWCCDSCGGIVGVGSWQTVDSSTTTLVVFSFTSFNIHPCRNTGYSQPTSGCYRLCPRLPFINANIYNNGQRQTDV